MRDMILDNEVSLAEAYQERDQSLIERQQSYIEAALAQAEGAVMILNRCKEGLNDLTASRKYIQERISAIEKRLTEKVDQTKCESPAYKNCPLPDPPRIKGKGLKRRSSRSTHSLTLIKG